jgi:hypothetical protein
VFEHVGASHLKSVMFALRQRCKYLQGCSVSDNNQFQNPLDRAAAELRDICRDNALLAAPFDAGSLARMLVHIRNINQSVLASSRDHVNAAKRLGDFAVTLGRIAKHVATENGDLAQRVTNVAKILQAAGIELANNDAIPQWPAPAISH